MRCTNTPNSVKVDFYTSKCKKKVKFNRKIVSLVGESFYTKGCKSVKVNFYTLWCNGQHSKEYPSFLGHFFKGGPWDSGRFHRGHSVPKAPRSEAAHWESRVTVTT